MNLVKKNDSGWTVQERADYPANFEQVSDLLRKLWDLKTVQEVKAGAVAIAAARTRRARPRAPTAGTLVEFKDKDGKTLNALLLGQKAHAKSGRTGRMGDLAAASPRAVTSRPLARRESLARLRVAR